MGPVQTMMGLSHVVLIRGDARQWTLLAETARATGVAGAVVGRPTFAVLPEAINSSYKTPSRNAW